jgi:hypothetical protein
MRTIRVEHAFDVQPSLPDTATEVVHQTRIARVEHGLGLARLRA